MSEVTTTRRIDLARLDAELGGVGLQMAGNAGSDEPKVITAPVGVSTLEAAVAVHQWADKAGNRGVIVDGITQGLDALQQIIDAPQVTFSNLAQAQVAMRDIQTAITAEARQLRRLSRIALGLLDGTD